MSDYIVSARKYRPDSFETLIGQDNIIQTLKNSIKRGKLAHAYLFCGPRGVGKTTTARLFAKAINCSDPNEDLDPCGKCESCESFQEGRSYCIHELDAASNNGVEDIKNLMDQVQIPPQVGKYSVYIIDEVHMLSPAAFNAFLKTLEEPPAHAIFILATTEKHKILPTILSRCQTYDFNRISVPDIVLNLRAIAAKEDVRIDDESLHVIAQKADGAMRDALTIFDQTVAFCGSDVRYAEVLKNLNVIDYEYSFSFVDSFLAGDYASALLRFDEILSKGFNALRFVAALSSHFRDLLVAKNGGMDSLLELPESLKSRYKEQASKCSVRFLFDALSVTTQCEAGYKMAVNPRLHIEYGLMRLCFLAKAPADDAPVKTVASEVKAPASQGNVSGAKTAPSASDEVSAPVKSAPSLGPDVKPREEEKPVASAPVNEEPVSQETSKPEIQVTPVMAERLPEKQDTLQETTAAPERRARRRPVKSGSSLSLNSILKEDERKSDEPTVAVEDGAPGDNAIIEAWKTLPGYFARSPRLASTLEHAETAISEEDGVKVLTFKVDNVAQQVWIREKQLHSLEGYLQSKVSSSKIRLEVDVKPAEELKTQPYTDQEKATALMRQNGKVGDLIRDFGLETK